MTAASAAPHPQSLGLLARPSGPLSEQTRSGQNWVERNPVLQLQYHNDVTALTNKVIVPAKVTE